MNESEQWAEHLMRVERYSRQIEIIYRKTVREFLAMWPSYEIMMESRPENTPFSFDFVPGLRQRRQQLLKKMHKDLTVLISTGVQREWAAAQAKQDSLINNILKGYTVPKENLENLKHRNLEALNAFQERKIGGMNLSNRVWKITERFEAEMELIIDIGLAEGKTSTKMAQETQPLLNEPDRLYRRVRDARGQLQLSKAAKAYNPGQGIYRSSFKNAHRMARTEINMAYRVSDHERRMQNPFVVGYEVKRSNHPYPCPRCEAFKGLYPKSYIFRSNHPQCRCYAVAVMGTPQEIEKWIEAGADGPFQSINEVKQMSPSWREYVAKNKKRFLTQKEPDYWIRDNFKQWDISKGLKIGIPWE
ncbi:hypothetical protein [Dyadobacter sp. LHD-138]|uniref:hypothetical protein n=1 Tax=Dyadobacter sp. LHD-138 TaxID=3071413 RepID=UPI0027DF9D89|nr:hypothetical protein [Dyadobacter sp. LHD-138]MDQ6482335.1 hypothetical protein [Dyadobacter sp. LHD-138]